MRWDVIIKEARLRGFFTGAQRQLASSWVTCACGEQDPRIPRSCKGRPIDRKLIYLGNNFSIAVADNMYDLAEQVLVQIEIRSRRVLLDLGYDEEEANDGQETI
jgi:hypothetical protein